MRVEIVEIGKNDSSYYRKDVLIGKKGTFATSYLWGGNFNGGLFYFDDGSNNFTFCEVKTKPIFDDCGLSQ